MDKTLLNTKWLGTICVVVVSLIIAFMASSYTVSALKTIMPTVVTESADFLPITVENGAIVAPKDTLISKTYGEGDNVFSVVLDTRTDELSAADITNQGVYVSRKFIYGVKSDKTEVRSLSQVSNITLDQEMLQQGAEWTEKHSGGYIFAAIFLSLLIYISLAILIYAALVQLFLGLAMKVGFGRTLRVTTLGYLALFIIGAFAIPTGFIVTLVLLLLANYLVAKHYPQKAEEAA